MAIQSGLFFTLYEVTDQSITGLPDLSTLNVLDTGIHDAPWAVAHQPESSRQDWYALRFKGYIDVLVAGVYTFHLTSDDGSRFFFDGNLTINNDGLHGAVTVDSVPMNLSVGLYPFEVQYFEASGGEYLALDWTPPGGSRGFVPGAQIYYDDEGTTSGTVSAASTVVSTAVVENVSTGGPGLVSAASSTASVEHVSSGGPAIDSSASSTAAVTHTSLGLLSIGSGAVSTSEVEQESVGSASVVSTAASTADAVAPGDSVTSGTVAIASAVVSTSAVTHTSLGLLSIGSGATSTAVVEHESSATLGAVSSAVSTADAVTLSTSSGTITIASSAASTIHVTHEFQAVFSIASSVSSTAAIIGVNAALQPTVPRAHSIEDVRELLKDFGRDVISGGQTVRAIYDTPTVEMISHGQLIEARAVHLTYAIEDAPEVGDVVQIDSDVYRIVAPLEYTAATGLVKANLEAL